MSDRSRRVLLTLWIVLPVVLALVALASRHA